MTHQKRPGCALVTGASGDIGAQIALRLAQDGWNIAVGYATGIERAEEVAGRIRECGVSAMPIKIDVTSTTSVDDAFDALEDSLGQVTVLVNNAGIRSDGLVAGLSDDEWDAAISTNFKLGFSYLSAGVGVDDSRTFWANHQHFLDSRREDNRRNRQLFRREKRNFGNNPRDGYRGGATRGNRERGMPRAR